MNDVEKRLSTKDIQFLFDVVDSLKNGRCILPDGGVIVRGDTKTIADCLERNHWSGRGLMSEWRPVATAPRDGTSILGFLRHGSASIIDIYQYWDDVDEPGFYHGDPLLPVPITHWMPLPSPPE